MLKLKEYRDYFQRIVDRVDSLTSLLPVTIDDGMARRIQALRPGGITLFLFPPLGRAFGENDAIRERNKCVIFLMAKYDPQRRTPFDILQETQDTAEEVKWMLINDMCHGCSPWQIVNSSIETAPETELYGTFAGWSLSFEVESD